MHYPEIAMLKNFIGMAFTADIGETALLSLFPKTKKYLVSQSIGNAAVKALLHAYGSAMSRRGTTTS